MGRKNEKPATSKACYVACNFEELPALDGLEIDQRYVNELTLGVQHLDIRFVLFDLLIFSFKK